MQAQRDEQTFGYIGQRDWEFPSQLHETHNDYPIAPERVNIQVEMLSDTRFQLSLHYARARANTNFTLVLNLMTKKKYVFYYLNLKFYMDHCMRLRKIHRGIKFDQAMWMERYISSNSKMRAQAKNKMENDLHKLRNNAV